MSGSGDETPPDSPDKKSSYISPLREKLSATAESSAIKARNYYDTQIMNPNSQTKELTRSTAVSLTDSVHSALNNANNLFNHLYGKNAPSRNQIRKTLELITNMNQMVNVWGENIVNWAKCDDDRITSIDCPCCYICGETISGATHMEHKIPSVPAYLNVPNILRIHGTPFFNKWETYIDASNNFEQLTQLYNLINCTTPYDAVAVNNKFNEIFDAARLNEETGSDYTYWRILLKFWMMEFAYAHAQCNLFKGDVIMCRPLDAGASDYNALNEDAEICEDNMKNIIKYQYITKKIPNAPKDRTIAMFNHLNETLNAVQDKYFERNPFRDNTAAVNNIINNRPDDRDIRIDTLIAMNMQFAMNAPQIYRNIKRINEIQNEINLGNTANRPELVILVHELNQLWPGTAERFGFGEYLYSAQSGTSTPPPVDYTQEIVEKANDRGRTKETEKKNRPIYRESRSRDNEEEKDNSGGAIKNKRRTQKRIASRRRKYTQRRKRNKKTTTRRKRYTRKQKK